MSIVGDILAVVKELRENRSKFVNAQKDDRDRIAGYFEAISDCLEATHDSLAKNEVPHNRCSEMRVFATALPNTLRSTVTERTAAELSAKLLRAHDVESLWGEFQSGSTRKKELTRIAEASGEFSALATSVRAGLDL